MLLSDKDIQKAIANHRLTILPFDKGALQPSSIDMTLDNKLLIMKRSVIAIDPLLPDRYDFMQQDLSQGRFSIQPGDFILGSTREIVGLGGKLAARLEGKSSLGRLGLSIHTTAGFIDPGFGGQITLELNNHGTRPIILRYGMKIGQLCLFKLSSEPSALYGDIRFGSRYQGQSGPTPSKGIG